MATETNFKTLHVFSSKESYEANKSQVLESDIAFVPVDVVTMVGNRGKLAGYEAATAGAVVNQDSPDSQYTNAAVTVQAGAVGTSWTKVVKMSAGSASFTGSWSWVGGKVPEFKYPGLLVCHWNNDQGLINYISGAA